MGRLADFDLNDSSPATSPHAEDGSPGPKAETAPVPAAPRPSLPDPKAKPGEQIAVCERAIEAAKARWQETAEKAMAEFLDEAGPFFVWVHENKLYKHLKDANGKPYKSFSRYCQERWGISRASGYRITRVIPLLQILQAAEPPVTELAARQALVLHPLRRQKGAEAVLKVWAAAWSAKKGSVPNPEELTKAITDCGYKLRPDEDAERTEKGELNPAAELDKAVRILEPNTVRLAVERDPERVVLLVKTLTAALADAGVPLD
ncbi:hypothetical protein AB0D10_39690 [Kitasatospora sp. NPDC048545]|uniref:hypothetical protein n=1 Tax=Kitasatospora sp. NPDC048545 TaxID=3157208 RepID=UPI0034119000